MKEEVNDLCDCFILTDLEQEELQVELTPFDEVLSKGTTLFVGKTSYQSTIQQRGNQAIRYIWRMFKELRFHELGSGLLMAEFEDNVDKAMVVRESPWHFDKNLILRKEFV